MPSKKFFLKQNICYWTMKVLVRMKKIPLLQYFNEVEKKRGKAKKKKKKAYVGYFRLL